MPAHYRDRFDSPDRSYRPRDRHDPPAQAFSPYPEVRIYRESPPLRRASPYRDAPPLPEPAYRQRMAPTRTPVRRTPNDRDTGSIPRTTASSFARTRSEVAYDDPPAHSYRPPQSAAHTPRPEGRLSKKTPRLMRAAVVIGIFAAVAISVNRVGDTPGGMSKMFVPTFMRATIATPPPR